MNRSGHKGLSVLLLLSLGCTGQLGVEATNPDGMSPKGEMNQDPKVVDDPVIEDPVDPKDPIAMLEERAPRARVVRLDEAAYMKTIATLFEGRAKDELTSVKPPQISAPFGWINPSDRFSTFYRSYLIDSTDFAQLEVNAGVLAERYVDGLDESSMGSDELMRMVIAHAGELLWRRPMSEQELDEYMAIRPVNAQATAKEALRLKIKALLLSPGFLFRIELGQEGEPGSAQRLRDWELATALSYTLTQGPPDEPLFKSVVDGSLSDEAVYQAHIERLLKTPAHRAQTKRFLKQFWRYGEATNIAKDESPKDVFPAELPGAKDAKYRPELLVQETDQLIDVLVEESLHQDFLATLLTTEKGFVRKDTAIFYNMSSTSDKPEAISFPAGSRVGVMAQPSWLVAFSEPDHNSPIRRGLFIQESLLCGHVPAIPVDVVPILELSEEKTLRESLAAHSSEASCAGCHTLMDPMGLPFEGYDHFGRARELEHGKPVDTSGALNWSGGVLDVSGEVAGPKELAQALARSAQVERCFVKHMLEFWAGRPSQPGDARAIEVARAAYATSGGDFNAALGSLLSSPVFTQRTIAP